MSSLRITLDVSAVPAQPAGAGRYIFELANGLASHDEVSPIFISRKDDESRWKRLGGDAEVYPVAPINRPSRMLWEQIRLPGLLEKLQPALHHGPHYTIPERAKVKKVATIHDMTFFDNPEWHERFKVPVFRRAIRRAVECSDAMVAVSADTARRLGERFGTGTSVRVVPLAVDHERFKSDDSEQAFQHDRDLLNKYGVSGKYVAFVGTVEPRKDVPTLLRAFDRIADHRDDLRLVIAGRAGWGIDQVVNVLHTMRHADRVLRLGFIPDELIPALLRRARVVAYPSLVEGFGLPALEALACGAPLVTTRGSAMEEVVEDAAVLINPGNVAELANAIDELVDDGEMARRLHAAGPKIAAKYTWSACVNAHVELYKSLN